MANDTTHTMAITNVELGDEASARRRAEPIDEAAFRAFYDRTARVLALYLRRMTGDAQLADDLLQESYYRFIRAQTVYESETHRRNSLFRIATNLAFDSQRTRRRWPSVSLDGGSEAGALAGNDRGAAQAEGRADLQKALMQLKPHEREALWLAYGLGSSHAEIAESVGMKAGSVKLFLFRARRKLAKILKGGARAAR